MERTNGRDLVLLHDSPPQTARLPRRPQLGEVVVVGLHQGQRRELRRLREEVRDLRDAAVCTEIRLSAWGIAHHSEATKRREAEDAATIAVARLGRARAIIEIVAVVALAGWILAAALLWITLGLR